MAAPDLVVRGRIATLAGDAGFGWVEAVAIVGGRVIAAGSRSEVGTLAGAGTRVLDLAPDQVALPGITDAHLHLADAALAARALDLEGLGIPEALRLVANGPADGPAEGWITGAGWDPASLGRWPTADDLEAVAPGRHVLLWSHDRHALWVSHAVLRRAGLDAAAADPPGAAIRRGERDRSPSGVLHETAVAAALSLMPAPSAAVVEAAIHGYGRRLLGLGITAAHDPGGLDAPDLGASAIARLSDAGQLTLRVHRSVRPPDLDSAIERGRPTGAPLGEDPDGRARMGWLKLFTDGALGSRTALLVEPYEGTGDRGIAVSSREELAELAARAMAAGIVPQIHAIGDAALRTALEVLESVARPTGRGPMARVEHVQLARPEDLSRFASARIAASIQPIHLRTDRDKAFEGWGRVRSERDAFRIRSLLDTGAVVAFGTDAPVEPVDPWPGLALAVTRQAAGWTASRPFGVQEAVDLANALRAATVGPATIAADPLGGRLVRGSRADLIVIPSAALDEPVEPGGLLERVRPSLVLVEGRVAHET